MFPEDIDDLFRDKLDGHATPPAAALWARLQATPPGEPAAPAPDPRLDQLFQQRLGSHATPPQRELWERLEDEHLRPRKRLTAAWWPMALAAAVALLLVAGGAGLWLGFPSARTGAGSVAVEHVSAGPASPQEQATTPARDRAASAAQTNETTEAIAANKPVISSETQIFTSPKKNVVDQATRPAALASTASKASQTASEQPLRHLKGTSRQPDADAQKSSLVARATTPPVGQPAPATPVDELRKAPDLAQPVVAQATPAPTPENVPVGARELITVDVRVGNASSGRPALAAVSAVAASEAPAERRRLGGRLLQQAGHLVRGERVNLAEVTGLPDNVTVRATLGGRTVSKSIQM
jgi:hypothetical protein